MVAASATSRCRQDLRTHSRQVRRVSPRALLAPRRGLHTTTSYGWPSLLRDIPLSRSCSKPSGCPSSCTCTALSPICWSTAAKGPGRDGAHQHRRARCAGALLRAARWSTCPLPTASSRPSSPAGAVVGIGDQHRVQARVVSVTQSRELGTRLHARRAGRGSGGGARGGPAGASRLGPPPERGHLDQEEHPVARCSALPNSTAKRSMPATPSRNGLPSTRDAQTMD